jgi:hypothetical protein
MTLNLDHDLAIRSKIIGVKMGKDDEKDEVVQPKFMTNEDFNNALDQRLGRFFGKVENLINDRFKVKDPEEIPVEKELSNSNNSELEIFRKTIKKEQEARKDLENRLSAEKIQNELASNLRGKVSDTWQDVAIMQLKNNTRIKDGVPYIEINDMAYPIQEGITEWLKQDSNKRYLPAPVYAKSHYNSHKSLNYNNNNNSKENLMQLVRDKLEIKDFLSSEE